MPEDTTDELSRLIDSLYRERDKTQNRLEQVADEIRAVEQTIDIYRRKGNRLPQEPLPNVKTSELQGLSQLDALILIAERHGKRFKVTPVRRLMVDAGLFKNPQNASGALHTLIQRSGRFEKINKGEYRLIATHPVSATASVNIESRGPEEPPKNGEAPNPAAFMPQTNQPVPR